MEAVDNIDVSFSCGLITIDTKELSYASLLYGTAEEFYSSFQINDSKSASYSESVQKICNKVSEKLYLLSSLFFVSHNRINVDAFLARCLNLVKKHHKEMLDYVSGICSSIKMELLKLKSLTAGGQS